MEDQPGLRRLDGAVLPLEIFEPKGADEARRFGVPAKGESAPYPLVAEAWAEWFKQPGIAERWAKLAETYSVVGDRPGRSGRMYLADDWEEYGVQRPPSRPYGRRKGKRRYVPTVSWSELEGWTPEEDVTDQEGDWSAIVDEEADQDTPSGISETLAELERGIERAEPLDLTHNEQTLLDLRANGWDYRRIAEELGITKSTVERRIDGLKKKLANRSGCSHPNLYRLGGASYVHPIPEPIPDLEPQPMWLPFPWFGDGPEPEATGKPVQMRRTDWQRVTAAHAERDFRAGWTPLEVASDVQKLVTRLDKLAEDSPGYLDHCMWEPDTRDSFREWPKVRGRREPKPGLLQLYAGETDPQPVRELVGHEFRIAGWSPRDRQLWIPKERLRVIKVAIDRLVPIPQPARGLKEEVCEVKHRQDPRRGPHRHPRKQWLPTTESGRMSNHARSSPGRIYWYRCGLENWRRAHVEESYKIPPKPRIDRPIRPGQQRCSLKDARRIEAALVRTNILRNVWEAPPAWQRGEEPDRGWWWGWLGDAVARHQKEMEYLGWPDKPEPQPLDFWPTPPWPGDFRLLRPGPQGPPIRHDSAAWVTAKAQVTGVRDKSPQKVKG